MLDPSSGHRSQTRMIFKVQTLATPLLRGLELPSTVLELLYFGNAQRLLGGQKND